MEKFFKNVGIRVIKTMAQAALGYIGSAAVLAQVDWRVCASTVILAGICCILMNLTNLPEDDEAKEE